MDALRQGLRYAWRMLVRSPGFTTLATVALPYAGPERLALAWSAQPDPLPVRAGDFSGWRDRNDVFVAMAAFQPCTVTGGATEQLGGVRASAELFSILGVSAAFGRHLHPPSPDTP